MYVTFKNKFVKRLISLISAAAVFAGVFPFSALSVFADTTETAGAFSITYGSGGAYTYEDNVLTITSGGTYKISMASGVTSTSSDRIVVKSEEDVQLTISSINITSSEDSPFRADSGNLTLILSGSNYLTANSTDYEGLSKTSDTNTLKITSSSGDGNSAGSLTAAGGTYGAGIGGGYGSSGKNITIAGGTVTAAGGTYGGAGIGGGYWGGAYGIKISGGIVNASSSGGAAIGGGFQSDYSDVTISGGTVNASSGWGAAIGGSDRDYGTVNVTINNGYIKTSTDGGDGIGGGYINSTSTKQIAITGGYFAEGDTAADTVCGAAVYTGYQVISSSDTNYPYTVLAYSTDFSSCAFIVTGDNITPYDYYTYKNNVLTIKKGGTYRISMNTDIGTSTTTDRIVVYTDSTAYITISNINITSSTDSPLRVSKGNAVIRLDGDNYLTSTGDNYPGLAQESTSSSLKITSSDGDKKSTGSLTAAGGTYGAGIGGGSGCVGCNITINGGTVNSNGGANGAGIGGGSGAAGSSITVNGGSVTASGGTNGAGIGGGDGAGGSSITLWGGTVTANGGEYGAGIGGGNGGGGDSITVRSGTVNATGGAYGAGVGGGYGGNCGDNGSILIVNGTLTAQCGTYGAGIGGGYGGNGSNITIRGGTVAAYAFWGAGIGGAYSGGSGSNITIDGGNVTARSSSLGAGIGGGNGGSGSNITINDGTVTTYGDIGAGIGGGSDGNGSKITINGGSVTSKSNIGAGIGGGNGANGRGGGNGSNITINGGNVTATSYNGAGIGSGYKGTGSNIKIAGGTVTASSTSKGAGIGGGNGGKGSGITIIGGFIKADSASADCIGSGYDANAAENITITGGLFAVGSYDDDTVYGISVEEPYYVINNLSPLSSGTYPYFVSGYNLKSFTITGDDGYTYENGVLTITESGFYDVSMNTAEGICYTQTDRIVVDIADNGGMMLSLHDVNIASTSNPPLSIESGEVNLELYGDNYLAVSGSYSAALSKAEGSARLLITSDVEGDGTLTAQGGTYGAGIGGYYTSPASDIAIYSGIVTAIGNYGAGIGGGGYIENCDGSNIEIKGGTVNASSSYGAAIGGGYKSKGSSITIADGYITAESTYGDCIGSGSAGGTSSGIVITGGYFSDGSVDDNTVCGVAVTNSNVELNTDTNTNTAYPYVLNSYDPELAITGTDISLGTDYSYQNRVLKILKGGTYTITMADGVDQTASDRIVVDADGAVTLTISNINITCDTESALRFDGGDAVLVLEGDNYLTSTMDYHEALSKKYEDNTLKITSADGDGSSTGSLTAAGAWRGAGIGGGAWASCYNIEIAGGTITATGGTGAAGIGGGYKGSACSGITISGGVINATGKNAAGIGAGYSKSAENIKITGGTITASGYVSIGSGKDYDGTSEAAVIDGGSLIAKNGFSTAPVNSNGAAVYLYTIPDTTEGETITVDGTTVVENVLYHTSSDTNQYVYLPLDSAYALTESASYMLSYTETDGTVTTSVDPIGSSLEIPNAAMLHKFAQIVNNGYTSLNGIVTADIDFTNYTDMIGSAAHPYKGTFDGGEHTITVGYNITSGKRYIGLFGYSDGGTIKNLKVDGYIDFTDAPDPGTDSEDTKPGYSQVGGVVGFMNNGTISNVVSDVDITSSKTYQLHLAGGIVGSLYDSSSVDKCMYTGSFTAYKSYDALGGIAGYTRQSCSITNCANLGTVSSTTGTSYTSGEAAAPYLGGIIGYVNHSTFGGIQNCYNYGSVSADDTTYCGAIVGWLRNSPDNLTNNYWLETSAAKAYGANDKGYTEPDANTADDFESGKIAYLLDDGSAVWTQTIGTDLYPVFDGETVYSTVCGYSNNQSLGDVWFDGTVDKKDAAAVLKYVSGIYTADNESLNLNNADANNDKDVNILDSNAILKALENSE